MQNFIRPLSFHWLLIFSALGLLPAVCRAADDERPRLQLLDRDSLSGWQYGDPDSGGWSVKESVLQADSPQRALLSAWTFGDFELRIRWTVEGSSTWTIGLPEAPSGATCVLEWGETPAGDKPAKASASRENSAKSAVKNGKLVTLQSSLRVPPAAEHVTRIARKGAELRTVDDQGQTTTLGIGNGRFGLSLDCSGKGTIKSIELTEPPGEAIFDGRDLAGWRSIGNPESWLVEDGKIVCMNKKGKYLATEKIYGNFTLSAQYKIAEGGNSGFGIRTPREGWPSGDGMELQILDEPPGTPMTRHSTMAVYGNLEPLAKADKSDRWNDVTIKADGYMISAWINGVLVQQSLTSRLPELQHRHLTGWIGLQDHNNHVEFRNLRVLEAPPGEGLTAWQKPRPLSGAELVLDRLMNLDVLARPDGSQGRAVSHEVASDGEEVVAELRGPGAVVELVGQHSRGRVALFFDGSSQAAVDCPATELAKHVPLVGPPNQPLLTYLPFKQSLKITASQAAGERYRLLYVTFPPEVRVEKFDGPDRTVPRGWLPAISYRYQQHGWARLREQDEDLDPRPASGEKTLDPGKSVSLLKLDGSGIAQWFQLAAPAKAVQKDDLWLEVRVDGEAAPAVAAPARFLFPGLSGGKKYQNFVVQNPEKAFLSRLAIPFGRGLEFSAVNRSKRPIEGVELTVSVDRTANPAHLSRLRGVLLRGDEKKCDLKGAGRWVGLVCSLPDKNATDPALEVSVDSKALTDWSGPGVGALFGIAGNDSERRALAGRSDGLVWGWLTEAPVTFDDAFNLR
ncbi:MAG TPA: DUF1080 domain-containing protein, partial [Pirellulales bacterium]|nr:DUF1080 domain-containing protein [Pirellulales bacterium]